MTEYRAVRQGKQRGLIGDVAETIRQAFGRVSVSQASLHVAVPDITTHHPPVVAVSGLEDLAPAAPSCRGELPYCERTAVTVALEVGVACLSLPEEMTMVATNGLDALSSPTACDLPLGMEECRPTPVDTRLEAKAESAFIARIPTLGLRRVALPELTVRPVRHVPGIRRPKRRDGMEIIRRTPVRRQVISPAEIGRQGAVHALRALVDEAHLPPRDIRLIGVFEPVPDLQPERLEVDAEKGILLLWYPLRARATGVLALAVGRHVADGRLIAARLPR